MELDRKSFLVAILEKECSMLSFLHDQPLWITENKDHPCPTGHDGRHPAPWVGVGETTKQTQEAGLACGQLTVPSCGSPAGHEQDREVSLTGEQR